MKQKIYIAGPMRGYPNLNFPAFHRAAHEWRDKGWEVFNPADADAKEAGIEHESGGTSERRYAKRDLNAIMDTCTAIYLLRGWSRSVGGALSEAATARWIGLDIVLQDPQETTAMLNMGESK